MLEQSYFDGYQSLNPFPGLRPFDTDESLLFFGRDGLNDTLLEKLRATRFVAVVGTSGSGKSSLVRAGLLPSLQSGFMTDAGSNWRVALFRPINNPIHNLAKSLLECEMFPPDAPSEPSDRLRLIEKSLRRSSLGLIEAARLAAMSPSENLLIVADQFEEVYRFEPSPEVEHPDEEASAFVKLLLEATRQTDVPIYVILTMRSDYLGESARFWGLPEAINRGQFLIPRMDDDERREAIEGPVRVRGGKISWSLVNRLLNDAGDDPRQLPILQHALMRTWEYWKSQETDSESLSLQHYDNPEVGGMKEALSIHADKAYQELTAEQKVIAEKMFKRLTEKGQDKSEGRLPATVDEIAKIANVDVEVALPVIEVFREEGRSFLMPSPMVPLTSSTLIDISHESLISGWTRLSGWVEEEAYAAKTYRRLAEDALLYPHGRGLLTNPELAFTLKWKADEKPNETWARRYRSEFGKSLEGDNPPVRPEWARPDDSEFGIAMKYLELSEQEFQKHQAAKERKRWKYFMWATATAAALFLGCLVLLGFSAKLKSETKRAEAERATAQEERNRAERAQINADSAREQAENSRAIADLQAAKAEIASRQAREAQAVADRERRNALDALALAKQKAIEADRLRADAVKAQEATQLQAKRGNILEEGIYLDLNRNSKDAIAQYKNLKTLYEASKDASHVALTDILIGNTILRSRNEEPAIPYFDNVLKLARGQQITFKPSLFVDIGDRLGEFTSDRDKAAEFYDYANAVVGDTDRKFNVEVQIKAAELFARSGKPEDLKKAAERYSKALDLMEGSDSRRIEIYMKRGAVLREARQFQEARDAYQKAADFAGAKNPADYGDAYRRIGDTYLLEKDNAKALETYKRALEGYALKDFASANIRVRFGDARASEEIAAIKEQSGDKFQAESFYRRSKKLYREVLGRIGKESEQLPFGRVEVYSRLDRVSSALAHLAIGLPDILQKTIQEKDIDAAVKQYKDLKENYPDQYNFNESFLNSAGYAWLRSDKVDEAIQIFRLNTELFPKSANTFDSLGEGYLAKGDTANAKLNYEKAVKLDPSKLSAIEALKRLRGR
jgi:tetratricopeptide (TPR) repeat protein